MRRDRFISVEKAHSPSTLLCGVLDVGRSGYDAWARRGVSARAWADQALTIPIAQIDEESRSAHGAPRIRAARHAPGVRCGSHRVARLMRAVGLVGCHHRQRALTTVADPQRAPAPDLIARSFAAPALDQLWLGDSTDVARWEGWRSLAVLLDAHARRVAGGVLADHRRADLARDALAMALQHRRPAPGLVHHTNRGAQYTVAANRVILARHGVAASMSRAGAGDDNPMAGRFFATLQAALIDTQPWPARRAAYQVICAWIEVCYNRQRHHSALGYRSPVAIEQALATEAQPA